MGIVIVPTVFECAEAQGKRDALREHLATLKTVLESLDEEEGVARQYIDFAIAHLGMSINDYNTRYRLIDRTIDVTNADELHQFLADSKTNPLREHPTQMVLVRHIGYMTEKHVCDVFGTDTWFQVLEQGR